jgi:2-keto-4-pentenoate hydratase/2-oxohepta-3-ene-1,7-dioic acid hydratase in catechol pathway
MKLLSYETVTNGERRQHLGALVEGDADSGLVIDLGAAAHSLLHSHGILGDVAKNNADQLCPPSALGFVAGAERSREFAEDALAAALQNGWENSPTGAQVRHQTEAVQILPAITRPPLLRDFMSFENHLLNVFPKLNRPIPEEWYRRSVYYKGNPSSIGAHRQDIEFPEYAEFLDLEFEFALIIGKSGINIKEDNARGHIYGYTIYNDFSARAIQSAEMTVGLGPAKGKDFVGAHVLGPVLVTADEIPDPYSLAMRGWVNGEQWTNGSSSDMNWKFEEMIAYASWHEQLQVGEVFGSGTVGDGSGAEQDKVLNPGDVIRLEMTKIGVLENRLVRNKPYIGTLEYPFKRNMGAR